jgi:hypothetical protein
MKPVVVVMVKATTPKGLNMKRSNERSEIIATGETCGSGSSSIPKGLNMKRSKCLCEIIALVKLSFRS